MSANSEYRMRIWFGIIAGIAFVHAASAQVPVIQPSDSLGEGFQWVDSDINDGTVVSGSVGTAVRVFQRTSSNDHTTHGFALSFEGGEAGAVVYDLRPRH